MDGKLMLVTNVVDLTPPQVLQRYKALADNAVLKLRPFMAARPARREPNAA